MNKFSAARTKCALVKYSALFTGAKRRRELNRRPSVNFTAAAENLS